LTRIDEVLRVLALGQVEFAVVGGVAAHGSPRATQDVDLVYGRSFDNISRLVRTLEPYAPYLRGAPPGLPFRFDIETVRAGLNFTLVTQLGWIDLLGEVAGGGTYESEGLLPHSIEIQAFGVSCRVLDLATLIHTKRAAGRVKDFEALAELEILRKRRLRPEAGRYRYWRLRVARNIDAAD
jgi:predicted nucleotidyltransferase